MASGIVGNKGIEASFGAEQKLVAKLVALMPDASFSVNGQRLTSAQVVAEIQQHMRAERELFALVAQLVGARARIKRVRSRARAVRQAVKLGAAATFGNTSTDYQALGFESPKLRKTTIAVRAESVDKAQATRTARGTKGSRQKRAIRGTVRPA